MSEQSISDKSQIIRNETQQHANTRGRVADVIDDINATKANKTDVTGVAGDISAHLGDFNNPHQVTKSQVGLGNVDNTADLDKPISNAVQLELDDIRTDIEGQTDWNVAQDSRLDQLEQHNIEQDTALGNKANTDASNISEVNAELWRKKLNVPQIPDSVISIGAVTADSSTTYLALPLTGKNTVLIGGQTYERTDAQSFPFTPVTTGEKILIIHALPDAQVFHLVQGAESTEAVEPSYSGLFVARLLVTTEGIDIEEATAGFKEKANDGWRYITLADNDPKILEVTSSPSHSFNLQPLTIADEPKIEGIKSVGDKNTWDGNELLFFIDGDSEVTFVSGVYEEGLNYVTYAFAETVIGKPYTYMRFKRKNYYYHHIPAGGGGKASEVENDSTVAGASVKDALETQAGQIAGKIDKPTSPNNVSTRVVNADGSTSDKGNFQLSEQIEISTSQTAQDAWKGKEIWVTASCTLTIPAPSALSAAWNIDILVFPSVTLTLAITSGGGWLHTTPGTVTDAFFRIARRGNTTTFKTLGL